MKAVHGHDSSTLRRLQLCALQPGAGAGQVGVSMAAISPRSGACAVPMALVFNCNFEVSNLLTKFLCTERPICFLLQPIYSLNSNSE